LRTPKAAQLIDLAGALEMKMRTYMLGHFELHMSTIGADVHVDKRFLARDENSSTGFDKKEIEANLFAAELLVPRQMLLDELRGRTVDVEMDDELLDELAKTFGVSKQMMAIRVGKLF
jgi:Zn-dependent peptidase ImmA (M78 family)